MGWRAIVELKDQASEAISNSRADAVYVQLRKLWETDPDIEATAVASVEGTLIASSHDDDILDERLAAMAAAMVGWGERIALELKRGALDQVLIRGAAGSVILAPINDEAVLTVLIKDEVKLGLVLLDMRRSAAKLAAIFRVAGESA